MLSQVAICNRALAKLGDQFIIDLTDGSKQARACENAYVPVRDALLRAHRWTFAMTRTQLAADSAAPSYGFRLRYLLPIDLLRLDFVSDFYVGLDLTNFRNSPNADYMVEGRYLLTDLAAPLKIRYLKRVEDSTQFDPLFDEALATKLAAEMATTLSQSDALKQTLEQDFAAVLKAAVRTNAIERAPEIIASDTWEMARI